MVTCLRLNALMAFKSCSTMAAVAVVFASVVSSAHADDLQIGSSRFAAMAGAGIALPFGGVDSLAFNAARFAYNHGTTLSGLNLSYSLQLSLIHI